MFEVNAGDVAVNVVPLVTFMAGVTVGLGVVIHLGWYVHSKWIKNLQSY